MEDIRQYIICVTSAAIISGILITLAGKNAHWQPIIKMLCGLFLTITAVSPWLQIRFQEWVDFTQFVNEDSIHAADFGVSSATEAKARIIKSRCEAYILDKAVSMGITVTADVTLSEQDLLTPYAAELTGNVSPYAKRILTQYISNELGIPEELQKWK